MKQKLIDFLVCPTCRKDVDVKIQKKQGSEIIEGSIKCHECKDDFKITNGIPRFVIDNTKDFVKTEDAFSEKWKRHHRNHHKKDWVDFQRKWFLDRYGWKTKSTSNVTYAGKHQYDAYEQLLPHISECDSHFLFKIW